MDFTSTDECESAAGNATLHFTQFLFVDGRNNRTSKFCTVLKGGVLPDVLFL